MAAGPAKFYKGSSADTPWNKDLLWKIYVSREEKLLPKAEDGADTDGDFVLPLFSSSVKPVKRDPRRKRYIERPASTSADRVLPRYAVTPPEHVARRNRHRLRPLSNSATLASLRGAAAAAAGRPPTAASALTSPVASAAAGLPRAASSAGRSAASRGSQSGLPSIRSKSSRKKRRSRQKKLARALSRMDDDKRRRAEALLARKQALEAQVRKQAAMRQQSARLHSRALSAAASAASAGGVAARMAPSSSSSSRVAPLELAGEKEALMSSLLKAAFDNKRRHAAGLPLSPMRMPRREDMDKTAGYLRLVSIG
eukprot:PLAT14697.1.p1 GENE.PLAT14697.1~~PLAT14697.1.p1  ORF type:complete len:323 (-),score=111.31 PLAT14697.1:133-1068(-)